jgi:hypothetical protein
VSIVGFAPTFDSPQYLVAGVGGLARAGAGLGGSPVAPRVLSLAGATIGAYIVFGGALALPHTALLGVVPTLETLQQLALGTITSWKRC